MSKKTNKKQVEETPPVNKEEKDVTVEKEVKETNSKGLVTELVDIEIDYPKNYALRRYYKQGAIFKDVDPVTANMLIEKKIAKVISK